MSEALPPIPTRHANPFATCWTRPGAIGFLPYAGIEPDAVVARLARCGWRGQVVGPHGAGKSTLLHALAPAIAAAGRAAVFCGLDSPRSPGGGLAPAARGAVLLVEGFERLAPAERRRRVRVWHRGGLGWVVITHRVWRPLFVARVPVLAELAPDAALFARLFERLVAGRATPVTLADGLAAFARRRGDLREAWFDVYDLHERIMRPARTAPVAVAYQTR